MRILRGHSTQHCPFFKIEKRKKCLERNGVCGAFVTDLSKACNCLSHSLLIAKRRVCRFDKNSKEYFKDYLSYRKQKIKVIKTFRNWQNILHGVPQGSMRPAASSMSFFLFTPNTDWFATICYFCYHLQWVVQNWK